MFPVALSRSLQAHRRSSPAKFRIAKIARHNHPGMISLHMAPLLSPMESHPCKIYRGVGVGAYKASHCSQARERIGGRIFTIRTPDSAARSSWGRSSYTANHRNRLLLFVPPISFCMNCLTNITGGAMGNCSLPISGRTSLTARPICRCARHISWQDRRRAHPGMLSRERSQWCRPCGRGGRRRPRPCR
jgi:hypothetical protein